MTIPLITGVILAGGEGRRMGGVDKGLQLLHGKPLAGWVLERFSPQVSTVLLSANRNIASYTAFGHQVITDRSEDFAGQLAGQLAGPLAGVQAGLRAAETEWVATVPCDSPFLPLDLVQRLYQAIQASDADIAVPSILGRVQRAFCLTRRCVLPQLDAFLASGERKIGLWHSTLKVCDVSFDGQEAAFANLNTPDDLSASSLP